MPTTPQRKLQPGAIGATGGPAPEPKPVLYAARSEEASEMLERTPAWLFKWGLLSILIVFLTIFGIAVLVRYPDTLEGPAVITTDPLPIRPKVAAGGRIMTLFVQDGQQVAAGLPIAEIQNPIGYEHVAWVAGIAEQTQAGLKAGDLPRIQQVLDAPQTTLGELQAPYNQLLQHLSAYVMLRHEQIYDRRVNNLKQQIGRYQTVSSITVQEAALLNDELRESAERFAANEKLYQDKVISRQEYFDEAARLRAKRVSIDAQRKTAVMNRIATGDNSKQLLDIEYDKAEKERTIQLAIDEALRNLQNTIQNWKLQYLVAAPYKGTVHFLRPLQVSEPVAGGEELFAVIPDTFRYIAQASVPALGLGKLKAGQQVHLMLAQFPFNEYGYLEGRVSRISALRQPAATEKENDEPLYRVDVALPENLVTSYRVHIPFSPEMAATARIITRDRSLFQRLTAGMMQWNK